MKSNDNEIKKEKSMKSKKDRNSTKRKNRTGKKKLSLSNIDELSDNIAEGKSGTEKKASFPDRYHTKSTVTEQDIQSKGNEVLNGDLGMHVKNVKIRIGEGNSNVLGVRP